MYSCTSSVQSDGIVNELAYAAIDSQIVISANTKELFVFDKEKNSFIPWFTYDNSGNEDWLSASFITNWTWKKTANCPDNVNLPVFKTLTVE